MDSQVIRVNGIDLHYTSMGKGDPLLLLHGWTQTSGFWGPYVEDLATRYQVYSLDLRGHGKSGILTPDFNIQKASQDVKALIEKLRMKDTRAIGLSYGGLILLEIAKHHPSLLSQIVVIGISDHFDGRERWRDQPQMQTADLDKTFLEMLRTQHPYGDPQINALLRKDIGYSISLSENELKAIQAKMLIISGDRDEVTGIEGALRIFRNAPDSQLWIVPNAGHLAISDKNKSEFLRITHEFFQQ